MTKRKKTGSRRNKLKPGTHKERVPKIVTKGMASSKDRVQMLTPGQPLPHECDKAGRCCWGGAVGLTHYDIWYMIKSGHLAKFGFNTTLKLTHKETGVIIYGLGPVTELPVCFLKLAAYQGKEGAAAHCPFLQWDESQVSDEDRKTLLGGELPGLRFWKIDGKPRFVCGLGLAKPIQCYLYPLGRIGEAGSNSEVGKWRFFCDVSRCRRCMAEPVRKAGCGFTVSEHLARPEIRIALEYTRDYIDLITMLARRGLDESVRQYVADMMFNFDAVLLDGGATPEILEQSRPATPDELMRGVAILVAGVMAKQAELRKEQESEETPSEEGSLIVSS